MTHRRAPEVDRSRSRVVCRTIAGEIILDLLLQRLAKLLQDLLRVELWEVAQRVSLCFLESPQCRCWVRLGSGVANSLGAVTNGALEPVPRTTGRTTDSVRTALESAANVSDVDPRAGQAQALGARRLGCHVLAFEEN
jgi:hypothetical protein